MTTFKSDSDGAHKMLLTISSPRHNIEFSTLVNSKEVTMAAKKKVAKKPAKKVAKKKTTKKKK